MARTVTQLTTTADQEGDIMLIVVCSDGNMYYKDKLGKSVLHQPTLSEQNWVQIANVPQT